MADLLLCCRCKCPPMFDGPECQQTKHSFLGNGYAWFSPIRPCFQSHISLEFITEAANGLLFYNGPIGTPQPGEKEDFIALGMYGKLVTVYCTSAQICIVYYLYTVILFIIITKNYF